MPLRGKPFGTVRPADSAVAQPFGQLFLVFRECAARAVFPDKAVGDREAADVGNAAVLVPLQAHALAAGHLRHLRQREDQHLAVFADDGDVIAADGDDKLGLVRHGNIHDLLALAGIGGHFRFRHDKAVAGGRDDHLLARRIMDEGGQHILIVVHVDHDAQRLAVTASAGQLVAAEREDLAAGRDDKDLVRRLRREGYLQRIAFLEGAGVAVSEM